MAIWFTSDWHFCHDKDFIYRSRGFNSVWEMNTEIIKRFNSVVAPDDIVYELGDEYLMNDAEGLNCIRQLHGFIYCIRGNHTTDTRAIALKNTCPNIADVKCADIVTIGKQVIYLSHYPTIVNTPVEAKDKHRYIINLFGHTHQTLTNFYGDNFCLYHVGVDSHNLYPVNYEDILKEINHQKQIFYNK